MKKIKEKPDLYVEILKLLEELHSIYPTHTLGKHLSTALEEYGDLWGVPDSEILYSIEKYKATLEYNNTPHETNEEEIEEILKDGMNLSASWEDEEEDI